MAKRPVPTPTNRLIPYVRQSQARPGETKEDSLSLDAQDARIRDWGLRREYLVLPAIRDHDLTGADPARPGIADLQATAGPGDTVAVYMWDRLARDILLQETIVRALTARGIEVVSITEASDPFSRQIKGVISEHFSRQLSERVSDALHERHARGHHHGTTPYGYQRPVLAESNGRVLARGGLQPDPATAPHVVALFTRATEGISYRELAAWIGSITAPPRGRFWGLATLRDMLSNPVYAGGVRMHGEIVWGASHQPLIDRALWEAAQRPRVVHLRRTTRIHWAEGLVRHSCNAAMLCTPLKRPGVVPFLFYICNRKSKPEPARCTAPRTSLGADKLTWAIRRCLAADLAATLTATDAIAYLDAALADPAALATRDRLGRERIRLETRLLRARELWLAGHDPVTVYEAERAKIQSDLAAIEAQLATLPARPDHDLLATAATRLADLGTFVATVPEEHLRAILELVGHAEVNANGVSIRYAAPYNLLIPTPVTILPPRRLSRGEMM